MVTLKAFYYPQLHVRDQEIMHDEDYLHLRQSEKATSITYLSILELMEIIGAYLVHMLRRVLSRLDYADGTCKI